MARKPCGVCGAFLMTLLKKKWTWQGSPVGSAVHFLLHCLGRSGQVAGAGLRSVGGALLNASKHTIIHSNKAHTDQSRLELGLVILDE